MRRANTLRVGDRLRAVAAVLSNNGAAGANTVKGRINGIAGALLFTAPAVTFSSADVVQYESEWYVSAVGASGNISQSGGVCAGTSGTATKRAVVGQVASAGGNPLFVIAENGDIELDADVTETLLPQLKVGQKVAVLVGLAQRNGVTLPYASVEALRAGQVANAYTRTLLRATDGTTAQIADRGCEARPRRSGDGLSFWTDHHRTGSFQSGSSGSCAPGSRMATRAAAGAAAHRDGCAAGATVSQQRGLGQCHQQPAGQAAL